MNQNLETLKIEAKALKRFKFLKLAGVFLVVFIISFIGTILFSLSGNENFSTILFFMAFVSFLIAFISIAIYGITFRKKDAAFKDMLFTYLWRPLVLENTFHLKNDYELRLKKETSQKIITHPMIPQRAIEDYVYTVENITASISLHAVYYYTRSSNGNGGSSTSTYFNGFAVETHIPISETLYVRPDKWYTKLSSQFGAFKNYRDEGDVLVNGTYTDQMKNIRKHFIQKGFDDIIFINENQKLMILLNFQNKIPRMKKYDQETYDTHKSFVLGLVDILEYVSELT